MTDSAPLHRVLDLSFEAALERVSEALKGHGFGVPTTIDASATLKKKLDVDFPSHAARARTGRSRW